jgi:YidC/Oxa1 family membrane protein insertase
MYDLIAKPLEFFYELWPNYAGAIALLTLAIMILLLPLTLKGTRSMLAMQKLQPELKKLQNKHRDDRQKLNEEVMKFYKENNINPMSGCLPLLLQMPVFFLLYQTLFQLLNRAPFGQDMGAAAARAANGQSGMFEQFGVFYPRHIEETSQLYLDLNSSNQMRSFGINLAESTQQAFSSGFGHAWPFLVLVLAVTATSYYQQRQIAGRNTGTQMNPQQAMLMKVLPLFFAFISFTLPAGIVVYFLVSNLFRIGQQAFITRTMYRDDDGPVETSGRAVDTSSTKKKGMLAQLREASETATASSSASKAKGSAKGSTPAKGSAKGSGKGSTASSSKGSTTTTTKAARSGKASGPSRTAPSNANRSRNKKKRK